MAEWHENESFWIDTAPVVFTPQRWKQAAGEVEQVCKLLDVPKGAAVLDVGCGPGRHALEFAKRGYRITGIDAIAPYLDEGKAKARERKVDVEFIRADMREFRREGAFDAAVNMLTTFGYFDDPADDRRVIENIFASLKPGGAFVMDFMGKEVLARIFREREWTEHADGLVLLEERKVGGAWERVDIRWILLRGETRREHRFSLRLYSASELLALLAGAGFADVCAYGSLEGAPYDHEAQRLVVVGRKP